MYMKVVLSINSRIQAKTTDQSKCKIGELKMSIVTLDPLLGPS